MSTLVHALLFAVFLLGGLFLPRVLREAPDTSAQIEVMLGDSAARPGEGVAGAATPPPPPPPSPPTEPREPSRDAAAAPPPGETAADKPPTSTPTATQTTPDAPPPPPPPAPPTPPPDNAAPPVPPPPPPAPAPRSLPPPVPPPPAPPSAETAAPARPTAPPAPPEPPPQVNLGGGFTAPAGEIEDRSDRIRPATAETNNLPPEYPPGAGERGEQGMVRLRLSIDELGLVYRVDVIASSGYPRLDQAAQDTLRTWRFKPALRDGKPVADTLELNINFRLR